MKKMHETISVIGLGYVGLPTALLFANKGFSVIGVDINPTVIQRIEQGCIPQDYPELADWWHQLQQPGGDNPFRVGQTPQAADVFLVTVPTPVNAETKHCDLRAVESAARAIAPVLQAGNLVILESTVPPGTTRGVFKTLLEQGSGLQVGKNLDLCFSPERILPGNTVYELTHNQRVVGGYLPAHAQRARTLFAALTQGDIHTTDDQTAEFCKLAENTYRDVNIALANELSTIADTLGISMAEARPLINQHPRVNVLEPGIGVGGHCIAVDPWFFVELAPQLTELIATSRRVNDKRPAYCAQQFLAYLDQHFTDKRPKICAVGLTYKPNIADLRESPAQRVIDYWQTHGLAVSAYDPYHDPMLLGKTPSAASCQAGMALAAAGCEVLVILVKHQVVLDALALPDAQRPAHVVVLS